MKKIFSKISVFILLLISFPKNVFASSGFGGGTELPSPRDWLSTINPGFGPNAGLGLGFFTNNVATFVISAAIFILFTASLIFLLIGGVMWITSGGNKEGMAKAKNTVTYAIIGLALGLAAFIMVNILGTFFGLDLTGGPARSGTPGCYDKCVQMECSKPGAIPECPSNCRLYCGN